MEFTKMTTKKNKDTFYVDVEVIWRDHENNYEHKSTTKTFSGKSKADVYGYIKYYCLMFGMVDCIHRGEGWGNTDNKPDLTDPLVEGIIEEETTEEPGLLL